MKKNFKWVFFAFVLVIATILPFNAQASTFTYDDLPELVKAKYSRDSQFAYGTYIGENAVFTGQIYTKFEAPTIKFTTLKSSTQWGISDSGETKYVKIIYSTYDIKNTDGTVFFSETTEPIPKALSQVLPNLLSQAKKILPVGLVLLSALLVVSLIPKVLYRLF